MSARTEQSGRTRAASALLGLWFAVLLLTWFVPATGTAKTGQMGSFGGVTVPGSPYRFAALPPHTPGNPTTVARIERDGGRVSRWWSLPGSFTVPAASARSDDGAGLSADGETLVLSGVWPSYPPRVSRFALLKTRFNYEWRGPGRPPHFRQFPKFVDLPGTFTFDSISPDGATVYLRHYRQHGGGDAAELSTDDDFEIRALDVESGKLRPRPSLLAFTQTPASDVYLVPNLDPDGFALGSRLNGRGVDLNRNFAGEWRPIGRRGDPEYSGPRPFSEPETRLAARIVRLVQPEVTIWFHQHEGSRAFVRAWGQSAPAARHFARLAQLPFHLLPWPAGTAPNWQNHRFPGASSFVVELPAGTLDQALRTRLDSSIVRLGRRVAED